jgi:diguanylate cyclase (GGDEF)-like protein
VSSLLITPDKGEPYYYALVRDVTEHRRDREMLAHHAIHDAVTGLYTRTLLVDRLETALERSRGGIAVVLADLDRFKLINDSLGHHVGDQLLVALGRRRASAVEPGDTLARFGGDEFAVLCENVRDPMDALARASRITRALEDPITLTSGSHVISASVGVAVAEGTRVNPASLLADADAALYRAKARGRGRVEMFDESLRTEVNERLELERDLRVALDAGQLFVEYQPTVNTYTGCPSGVEALVRWRHPTLGIVSPADFVPVAEDSGLITSIGAWVLRTATADLAAWQAALPMKPPLRVAVNVSGRQLATDDFVDNVACAIQGSGIAPGTLGLEITESLLLNNDDDLLGRLRSLKALGARLLLDDFGTGYSSLAYLKRFPMDVLKIDRSFIDGLGTEDEDSAIVEAIIKMAGALGLEVVAEGLESEQQLAELRRLGCHRVQGFLISPPMHPNEVEPFLREQLAVSEASTSA